MASVWTLALVLAIAVSAPVPTPVAGQTREHGPLILQLPASTSAMAMGGAFQLTGGRSDAIFYNPALLAIASGFGLDGHTFDSESNYLTLSATTGWWRGNVGVGLQALSYSTDATDGRGVASGQADLLTRRHLRIDGVRRHRRLRPADGRRRMGDSRKDG
jgi:hypothetical protein